MPLYTQIYLVICLSNTTIRLESSTKNELKALKNFRKESFDEVIERLVNIVKDEPLMKEEIIQIEKSLEDIKKGRVLSLKEAEKKWGI